MKVNNTFRDWKEIKFGVPQGSVLGPLLFNTFSNYISLFVRCTTTWTYADDTNIFACHATLEIIVKQLETDGTWLQNAFLTIT